MNPLRLTPDDARAVMRALIRDLNAQTRNGRRVPGWAHRILPDLAAIAESPIDRPDIGTGPAIVEGTDWLHMVPIQEAADSVLRSPEYVRRLARERRIRAHRVNGKAWVVDLDSLKAVLDRAA